MTDPAQAFLNHGNVDQWTRGAVHQQADSYRQRHDNHYHSQVAGGTTPYLQRGRGGDRVTTLQACLRAREV